jgi:hypothetical protein
MGRGVLARRGWPLHRLCRAVDPTGLPCRASLKPDFISAPKQNRLQAEFRLQTSSYSHTGHIYTLEFRLQVHTGHNSKLTYALQSSEHIRQDKFT